MTKDRSKSTEIITKELKSNNRNATVDQKPLLNEINLLPPHFIGPYNYMQAATLETSSEASEMKKHPISTCIEQFHKNREVAAL